MAYLQMHCDKFYGSNEILVILDSPTMISAIEYVFLEIRGLEKEIKAALLMRLREGGVEIYDMIVNWLQVKKKEFMELAITKHNHSERLVNGFVIEVLHSRAFFLLRVVM